jgi:hypothetical protein
MKHKLKITAWVLGIGLVVVTALIYVSHLQSKSALELYKDELRAAGEKLEIADFIPPRVPLEQNGAEFLRQAISLASRYHSNSIGIHPSGMQLVVPGKGMICWQQPDIRSEHDYRTNTWEQLNTELTHRAGELELLHKIIIHPALDLNLDYTKGFSLPLPLLAPVKRSAHFLSYAAISDLQRGNVASAMTNICAMLAIARGCHDERTIISQYVVIVMGMMSFESTWELLQAPNSTDEHLYRLQQEWENLEFIGDAEQALQMERAMLESAAAQMRNSSNPLESIMGGSSSSGGSTPRSINWLEGLSEFSKSLWNGSRRYAELTLWRVSWSYKDELRALQGQQALIEAARQVQTDGFFQNALLEKNRKLKALGFPTTSGTWDWDFYCNSYDEPDLRAPFSQSVVSTRRVLHRVMAAETAKRMAIVSIALKRYQLQKGSYPEDLKTLIPEFLSSVPNDPVDGKPLRYTVQSNRTFLLYSIGEDNVDDGGNPSSTTQSKMFSWLEGRDWVWPHPASGEEIEWFHHKTSAR